MASCLFDLSHACIRLIGFFVGLVEAEDLKGMVGLGEDENDPDEGDGHNGCDWGEYKDDGHE